MTKELFNKPRAVYFSDARPDPFEQLEAKLKESKKPKRTARRLGQIPREIFSKAIDGEALQGQSPFIKVRFLKESPQLKPLPHPQLEGILEASPNTRLKPRGRVRKPLLDRVVVAVQTGMNFPGHLWRRFFRPI